MKAEHLCIGAVPLNTLDDWMVVDECLEPSAEAFTKGIQAMKAEHLCIGVLSKLVGSNLGALLQVLQQLRHGQQPSSACLHPLNLLLPFCIPCRATA